MDKLEPHLLRGSFPCWPSLVLLEAPLSPLLILEAAGIVAELGSSPSSNTSQLAGLQSVCLPAMPINSTQSSSGNRCLGSAFGFTPASRVFYCTAEADADPALASWLLTVFWEAESVSWEGESKLKLQFDHSEMQLFSKTPRIPS